MKHSIEEIKNRYKDIPRIKMLLQETPLHKLENVSKDYGINVYLKREDMAGPCTFSGNKMRKLEFVMADALKNGVEYVITYGAYQSNSAMQIATACNNVGIKPILLLGDTKDQGIPNKPTGNLLLDRMLGAEIHYVSKPVEKPEDIDPINPLNGLWRKCDQLCKELTEKYEAEGKKVMFVTAGATHKSGWVSDVLNFTEMLEQSERMGFKIDYIYHTNGSCGTLPGLIAAKLILKSDINLRSINVRSWKPGQLITKATCCERVKSIFERLGFESPSEEEIYAEMNVDERFLGPAYGVPNDKAQECIKELARKEGVFLDPTYTGKGFSGLKAHIEEGLIPQGSNVVYIHTGGLLSFFADDDRLVEDLI